MELTAAREAELQQQATRIRRHIINMLAEAGSGHPGGSLSLVEIVTALYWEVLRVDPARPDWVDRDRFVLSKGHACPVLYAALAEKGFFPAEELMTLRKVNSRLQGHPDRKKTPGVEMSTGSLGQGLAAANGMALAGRLDGRDYRVYAVLGDGELNEGMVWEAAMAAAHFGLDRLTGFLDYNCLQIDGRVQDVMNPDPVPDKWRAFGWHVLEIDGHDFRQILEAVEEARATRGRPTMVVSATTKGKGCSFMEDVADWHGKAPSAEQAAQALGELA